MPSIAARILSIKQIDNYKPVKNELLAGKTCLLVESPYDQEFIESVKTLSWRQREWTGEKWVIVKDDPDRKEGETNLEFLRRIARDCASRRECLLTDYTLQSVEEIKEKKRITEAQLLENHVAAVLTVLPKLPSRSIRLIRWGEVLKFQLARYLGDEEGGRELFMELHKACVDAWKPWLLAPGLDRKMQVGFVFEVAADDRIVEALMQCEDVDYLKVCHLDPVRRFEDGTAHLIDDDGDLWLACDYRQVDMSQTDFDNRDWKVAEVDGTIYWVEKAIDFVTAWLEDSGYSLFLRVFFHQQSKISKIVDDFHLHTWFQQWAQTLLGSTQLSDMYRGGGVTAGCHSYWWQHPADPLVKHVSRFSGYGGETVRELVGLSPEGYQIETDRIEQMKARAAAECLADVRSRARAIVALKLESESSKEDLLQLASRQNVTVKKSWNKTKIAEAIATQEYAEAKLGIDKL